MTNILIQCPKCKTRYKLKNADEMEGTTIVCKKCRAPIRIRTSASATKDRSDTKDRSEEETFGDDEPVDDEFGVAAASPPPRLPARLPSRVKRSSKPSTSKQSGEAGGKKKSAGKAADGSAGSQKTVFVLIAVIAGVLVLGGLGVGGALLSRSLGQPTKYEAPRDKDYVDFQPQDSGVTCRIPKDWEKSWGGGQGGQPYWARFGDARLTIEARESISGGAMGQAAIAMQQKMDPGNASDALSPSQKVHEAQERGFAEDFQGFQEQPGRKIATGFGPGWIADFTAQEGMLKSTVNGCRATVLNSIHQFTVTFKCSPAMFKDAKPVFEKILSSMGPGRGP
jgi:DNA-directed RNA polymerase subunit M/transcription elongation factor TFIIS